MAATLAAAAPPARLIGWHCVKLLHSLSPVHALPPGRGVMPTIAGALQTEASLESHQRMVADKLSVSELMTTQLVALEPVMRVGPAPDQLLLP